MTDRAGLPGRLRAAAATPWIRALAVLWIAQVISEMAFSFALPFIPLYIQELGVEDITEAGVWAGVMAGGFAIIMGVMGPVWGMVADRFGRRLMIQRALFGACLIISAMSLVQGPEQLLVLRLLQGSVTGVVAAVTTVVSLTVPRARLAWALGLLHSAMFAGTSIGPIVGGLFADAFGFRAAFGATGLLFLIGGTLVTLFVAEPPRAPVEPGKAAPTFGGSIRDLLGRRELVAVIVLLSIIRFASMAPQPILPLYIQQLAPGEERLATLAGLMVAATGIASTVSALLVGHLSDRFGRARTLLLTLSAAALFSVPHAFVTAIWQLVALRVLTGLALGGMAPSAQALFTEMTPAERRGTAFGVLVTANAAGNGGGPVLGSLIAALYGVPAVFIAITPVFLAGIGLLGRVTPPGRASER